LFADASVDASRRATRETNSAAPGDRQTGRLDKLAARLAPFSEAVADAAGQYGIDPSVITAVIVAESGGKAHAVSPAGARGLMQIMPATGRELGLVNPFDPRENILAGTRYLSRMLKRFGGDITLALAAYNAGPGAVRKHGGIPPYRETMRFVSKVLALAGDLRLKGNSA
jgi:soluble lytic murein transglycosylase-like protein